VNGLGAVNIDLKKKERGFESLTLSDENVVKYLILFRDKVDETYGININVDFNQSGDTFELNSELIALYISLDQTISKCRFKEKELRFLKYLFEGYTIRNVIKEKLFPRKTTYRIFNRIVKRIVEVNKNAWKECLNKKFKKI
jgi:hypothetical protein